MATNNRIRSETDLFYITTGKMEGDGYISQPQFPYLQFCKDTWRKKEFYNHFMREWNLGNKEGWMFALKRVWCEHNTVCRTDRRQLTQEILVKKCLDNCPCCGSQLWYGRCNNAIDYKKARNNKPSIDKLDPDGGYTDENTWVICTTCNTMKQNATTPDRLRNIADAWNAQLVRKYEVIGLDRFSE